jgi:hypothetical protein
VTSPGRLAPVAIAAGVFALGLGFGCPSGEKPPPRPDAGVRPPRKVKPPPDDVRVFPPHAIRSDGVGPYLLDVPLGEVLRLLPEGPRVELLDMGEALSWRVVRAEEGRLLIGADARSRVAFIVVLDADVARLEQGAVVGVDAATLVKSLGPEVTSEVVRTRRSFELEKLPNVTFLTDATGDGELGGAKIVAALVGRGARPPASQISPSPSPCRSGGTLAALSPGDLWSAGHGGRSKPPALPAPTVHFGCITGAEPEAVVVTGDELVIVAGDPAKLRRAWLSNVGRQDALGALDLDGDGRDELVGLQVGRDDGTIWVQVRVFAWDGGRLATRAQARPIVIGKDAALAAGTSLPAIELWPEVWPAGDALLVGGTYVSRTVAGARVIAPLQAMRLRVDAGSRAPTPPGDAGVVEPAPLDAGKAALPADAGRRGTEP